MRLVYLGVYMLFVMSQAAVAQSPAVEIDQGSLAVSPSQISPNGDGVRDVADVVVGVPKGSTGAVRIFDSHGKQVCILADDLVGPSNAIEWDGVVGAGTAANGKYTVKAVFDGPRKSTLSATITVQSIRKWAQIRYTSKPFFPIGAWFEGRPDWGGYPSGVAGAKSYYDRCFADLAAHGFNTVTVPNCPESLWDTLLQSSQRHHIKVVLEIRPLVDLVTPETVTEAQVYAACKRVVGKLGKYQSLVRYQIRDEPPANMVANWLLVQRILASVDPSRPAFSCFCSPESLASLTQQTKLAEAVYDIYPQGVNTPTPSLGGFLGALDSFQSASRGNVQWPVLQSFAKPNAWRYPTAEELRAMTYLSLAAGAKGVFYFIYQSMPGHPEKLEGLVDAELKPTPMYEPASVLAKELRTLSPLIMSLKAVAGKPQVSGEARVGEFDDANGRRVLIVASTLVDRPINVQFSSSPDAVWKDALTGESIKAEAEMVKFTLGPGCGRVLVRQ